MNKRVFGAGSQAIEPRWAALSARISAVISRLMDERNIGKIELSKRLQYAHSTIVNTLNNKSKWSFTLLMLVAEELGVTITDVINAAENGVENTPWFALALEGTEPYSRERLQRVIRSVVSPRTSPEVLDLYFTVEMLEMSVPALAEKYKSGEISDGEMFSFLQRVYDNLDEGENFWVKVQTEAQSK